ncbi:D-glycero-beta-D-manno-heptose-1,7-bisphosphate 7-phosphatase [Variibacter gotjawalensis]|uniref:D,D-heptose 1,7-bisphosphate phosphatase n=1 Tax=Variibacter gotjawalensis TaxID=1333996 RepID=A0A0S3PP23_9BRAD|nr:HAD-IIIA family hydrolase [Variibacter gotjawalensis]NIK47905.1 D-glycero-D-manno-heptose 1,7-bisphosphate phosphatase [Variibacter gotjawalensis]RZS49783.1 D-glycero-D-manno-heptose 1,7-bisphosphate phosphatase [Variibacter gotjawalensis]BAT57612.1 D-glycero-beta-D-manno-heptose-1,7-bisphosphate 7-phosphatase [Variibacter gotjawalensis]
MSVSPFLRDAIGCWAEARAHNAERFRGKPALFLDRDGVVIEEKNYIADPKDVRLHGDVAKTIAAVNQLDCPVVIVTNQSGIARGYFDWTAFARVMTRTYDDLAAYGATIDFVYACGFHDSGKGPLGVADHPWRKPNPGMLLEAAADIGLDLVKSVIVGDKAADLAAAKAAGLSNGLLYAQGYGADAKEQSSARALENNAFKVDVIERLTADTIRSLR